MKRFRWIILAITVPVWLDASPSDTSSTHTDPTIVPYGRMQLMGFGQAVKDYTQSNDRIYLYLKEARFGLRTNDDGMIFDAQVAFGGEDIIVAPSPGISLQLLDFSIDLPVSGSLRFKAGQFKVPYGREGLTNSGFLSFGDRSIQYNAFVVGRDVGVAAYTSGEGLTGALGLFTGGGRDIPIKYLPEKLNIPMVVVRAGVNNGYDADILTLKQTDAAPSTGSAFFINALYTDDSRIGHSTVLNVKSSDKSLLIDGNWNPFIAAAPFSAGRYWQAGGDAAVRSEAGGNASVFGEAELNYGGYKNSYGSLSIAGGRIQFGYGRNPFEFALRYAFIQPDSKFGYLSSAHQVYPIADKNLIHEVTFGITWFLKGDRLKLTADLPVLFRVPVLNDPASGAYVLTQQPDQVSFLATGASISRQTVVQGRLQLQYAF